MSQIVILVPGFDFITTNCISCPFFSKSHLLHSVKQKLSPISKFCDTLPFKQTLVACLHILKKISAIISEITMFIKYTLNDDF